MSSTSDPLSKLSPALAEFVRSAAGRDNAAFGATEKDSAQVSDWIEKVSALKISSSNDLKVSLNARTHR